jgi:hypothetical protein
MPGRVSASLMPRASRTPIAHAANGKKVSGIKRHILVDTQGLPHAIAITMADVSDRQGALKTIEQNLEGLAEVTALLVDGG